MLVLMGGVTTASATDLYVCVDNLSWWDGHVRISAWGGTGTTADVDFTSGQKISKFGKNWYVYEITNSNTTAQVRYWYDENNEHKQGTAYSKTFALSSSEDKYVVVYSTQDSGDNDNYYTGSYTTPSFRDNGEAGWDNISANMTVVDNNTLSYTMSKSYVDAISGDDIWFRVFNFGKQINPIADGLHVSIGSNVTRAYNSENAGWAFGITKPTYDYDNIVITVQYDNTIDCSDPQGCEPWRISADAYISKTITAANQYATLGCSVPLEIVEANGVTAHPLTADASTGKITKGDAITVIPANEGALLENATGSDKTIRAKVLASASASALNQLVAFTGSGKLTQPGGNTTYYILTKKSDKVGFYKVNTTSGNSMGANTAYLVVSGTSARDFFVLDGETTGIANLNVNDNANFNADAPMYNLAGQRVGKNYKGVVIVNGKKMLNK